MREQRGMPVFVKVDQYKEILDVLELLKRKMNEVRSTLVDINKVREEEDAEIAMWNNAIRDIEKKIDNIDKMLFEPGAYMARVNEQSNEIFFVEVRDPAEVRRNILETLRQILSVLQRFEKFRNIRQEKMDKIQQLRILVKQANKMLHEIKIKLPQTSLRPVAARETPHYVKQVFHKKKKKAKPSKEEVVEKQVKMQKKPMTEIEKLESELNAIEGKLKSLS